MLINLRNALMAGKRLPYDAEVEYLESTGTQWIDTGFIPDAYSAFRVTCALVTNTSSQFMGCIGSNANNRFHFSFYDQGKTRGCMGATQTEIANTDRQFHTIEINAQNKTASIDGVSFACQYSSQLPAVSVWLFGRNSDYDPYKKYISVKIQSAKLYRNGVLVRDYIPVRKGTVGYLYDRVSGKLFGNAGTGDFVVGPDVVPVEYIESHGTEWLKIQMAASSACDITCDFQRTTFSQSAPFGGGDGNLSNEILILPTSASAANTDWTYRSGNRQNLSAFSASQTARHTVRWLHNAAVLDGTEYSSITNSAVFTATRDYMGLFCSLRNGDASPIFVMTGRVYSAQFKDATVTMPLSAVRVGTEGAMMDTLTRRIYRNAGTGAFGYGNDLKYPIPA